MRVAVLVAAAVLMAGASARAAETQGHLPPTAPLAANQVLAARPPVAATDTPASGAFHMASLGTYAEVLHRPLFAPDRRAHEAPQAAASVAGPFTLCGIVIQPAATYALVQEGKTTKRVTEGQTLGGGTVTQILRDRVVLNVNGVETAVKLFDPTTNGKSTPGLSTAGGFPSQTPPGFQPPVPPNRPSLSGG